MLPPPPRSTRFPYTTLLRSSIRHVDQLGGDADAVAGFADAAFQHRRDPEVRADLRDVRRAPPGRDRSEEHTSELQSRQDIVCRLLLEKKNKQKINTQLVMSQ